MKRKKLCLKRIFAVLLTLVLMNILSGCGRIEDTVSSNKESESQPVIMVRVANEEYDSIEEFRANSDRPVFLLKEDAEHSSGSVSGNGISGLKAEATGISVGETYVVVKYNCTYDGTDFEVRLATYSSEKGKESLQQILNRSGLTPAEMELDGHKVWYSPGMDIERYNCYMMVMDEHMVVINIEKGYDGLVEKIIGQMDIV